MKPTLRVYLSITLALSTIFGCGYGVGYLVGKKHQPAPFVLKNTSAQETGDWQQRTVARLSKALELSEEQQKQVGLEVEKTSQKIQGSRDRTLKGFYYHLLELHTNLIPHLNETQQKKIKQDQESLKRAIEKSFDES
ncbi:MAG: hypothetical protein ACON38_00240 [Akkermansiaceae bacterium]